MRSGRAAVTVGAVALTAALVGVATATTAATGGGPNASPGTPMAPAAATGQVRGPEQAADPGARAVDSLQQRLRRLPADWVAWAELGTAYVDRARVTGDPTLYPKAEAALARSSRIRPDGNDLALAGQAALAAARHDFGEALRLADAAVAVNPYSATGHGIRADALVELGRYEQAWQAVQTMVDLRPGVASLSRVAYGFELQGRTAQARETWERVLTGANSPADAAFAYYHLGELARNDGDLAGAEDAYTRGLAREPSNTLLLAGRARIHVARGRSSEAVADYKTVATRSPQPSSVIEYGELLEALGRQEEASAQYSLVRSTATLFRAQGVDLDVELALFEADHGDPAAALRALPPPAPQGLGPAAARTTSPSASGGARNNDRVAADPPADPAPGGEPAAAPPRRGGIFVDDARAWALHRLGRDAEALPYARAAVRLGTHRALFRYHLGVIEAALGQHAPAAADLRAALAMDPNFSPLHAPRAKALLTTLGGHA